MSHSYADPVVAAFVVIPSLLAVLLVWGVVFAWRRSGAPASRAARAALVTTAVTLLWMAATWSAASGGVLRQWDRRPPPFVVLVVLIFLLAILLAFGPVGRRLARFVPLWVLVVVQAFRLPLEIAMHALYERGVMPEQMSYSGRNFDVVTGATALLVAAIAARARSGRTLVLLWNVLGLGLLLNIVTVAFLSTPGIRFFGDDRVNVFVADAPFVWLPAVMVLAALAGHLVIFRACRQCSLTSHDGKLARKVLPE